MKKEKDIAYGSYRCAASDRGCSGDLHVPDGYDTEKGKQSTAGQAMQEEDSKDVTSKDAEAQDTGELAKNTTENQEATPSPTMNQDNPDNTIPPTQEGENTQETTESQESADTSAAVQPELNFTEDSQMLWPGQRSGGD